MNVTTEDIQSWLEWAGIRILSMPGQVGPKDMRAKWLWDIGDDPALAAGYDSARRFSRPVPPSAIDIPIMDDILLLPQLCDDEISRRIIQLHSLINPYSGQRKFSWTRIALKIEEEQQISCERRKVRRLYDQGMVQIRKRLPCPRARKIAQAVRPEKAMIRF